MLFFALPSFALAVVRPELALLAPEADALQVPQGNRVVRAPSRRDVLAAGALAMAPTAAQAVEACKSGANNCWSTASKAPAWTWPAGTSRDEAVKTLRAVLDAYPQAGQDGVDGGGWSFAVDELASKGTARLEFRSAGTGNFAKFFNGGKPFVDDLEIAVGDSSVDYRSSSRVGDSDFGVNAKRLNYLAAELRAKGWNAPGVKA